MPFSYYSRLSPDEQRVYRASDAIEHVALPEAESLHATVEGLARALAADDVAGVTDAGRALCDGICAAFGVGAIALEVLAVRPRDGDGELHGLYQYTPGEPEPPQIQVWMRTAHHRRVVAFRTFLRTLLHEVGHHLDLHLLGLPHSFHTDGFYKRESSLFRQLLPPGLAAAPPRATRPT